MLSEKQVREKLKEANARFYNSDVGKLPPTMLYALISEIDTLKEVLEE